MTDESVLIVGAGPVGMVLAAQLARHGVKARIVEKRSDHSEGSKALAVNAASLKVLDQMGVVEQFIERGEQINNIHAFWNGAPFLHIDCARVPATPYPFSIALPQPESEKILSTHLSEMGVEIERPVTLRSLRNGSDSVDVELVHRDGSVERRCFNYVVGCDGSRSMVRNSLGIRFQGRDYQSFMLLIDGHIDWPGKRTGHADYFVRKEGFIIVIPLPGGLYRIVMSENGSDLSDMKKARTLTDYQDIVDRFAPLTLRLRDVVWESQAPLYNRLSERFGAGRVLLAGDAAHLFSPIGGLGMNTGIQDAANLGWKLAGVLKSYYAESILETYRSERLEMARRLVAGTDETTSLITCASPNLSQAIKRWLPSMANRLSMRRLWPLTFTGLGQKYDGGALVGAAGGTSSDAPSHPLAGAHVPFALADDVDGTPVSSYRLARDYRPLFLGFPGSTQASFNQLREMAQKTGFDAVAVATQPVPGDRAQSLRVIVDTNGAYRRAFGAIEGDVFLLRPDGYVADVGRLDAPGECLKQAVEYFARAGCRPGCDMGREAALE